MLKQKTQIVEVGGKSYQLTKMAPAQAAMLLSRLLACWLPQAAKQRDGCCSHGYAAQGF